MIAFPAIASSLFLSQPLAFNILPRSTIEHEPFSPIEIDRKTNFINNQSRSRVIDSHLFEVNDLQESQSTKHLPLAAFALFISILSTLPQMSQAADLLQTPEVRMNSLDCIGQFCTSNVDAVLGCIGRFCTSNTGPGPEVQAEVLNDMAHVAFDLASFLTPENFILRFCSLVGRACYISVDCIPDHTVTAHEFFFQTIMLGVSANHFSRSAVPFFKALVKPTSLRDHFAFSLLFRPKHLSWIQYKILLSAMTWVEIPPQTDIQIDNGKQEENSALFENERGASKCDSFVYWIYKGDVDFNFSKGSTIYEMNKSHGKCKRNQRDFGLLGDIEFTEVLNRKTYNTQDSNKHRAEIKGEYKTGHEGATVLQIDTHKLMQLMEDDINLDKSIRSILLDSVQSKLGDALRNEREVVNSISYA